MFLRPASCPSCGGPVPEEAIGRSFATCAHCGATFSPSGRAVFRAPFRRSLEEAEAAVSRGAIQLRQRSYVPECTLAESDHAVVVLARVEVPVVERVVLKLARSAERVERERAVLSALAEADVPGRARFTTRLPQLVASGVAELDDARTPAIAVRARSGWLHTMRDVADAFPDGVDGRHVVWMWRRVLETLGFAHRAGWVHRRLSADHLVVGAHDHGVLVVGWAGAAQVGDAEPRADLAALARVFGDVGAPLPEPLATLLRASLEGAHADAWALGDAVGHAARAAYGPPAFHPLSLPAFRR